MNKVGASPMIYRANKQRKDGSDCIIGSVSQQVFPWRLLSASGCLGKMRSVTTDNGCEFLDRRAIDRALKTEVYYTHTYASWEKRSVENANRMVRRRYPEGTDLSQNKGYQQIIDSLD